MTIQIIKHDDKPQYAVVPFDEWEALIDRLEELEDLREARAISAAIAEGEETYPHELLERLLRLEEHPLKIWREYRGLTLAELAKQCGVSSPALSQIETGKRTPSVDLLTKLAKALRCDMEDLIRPTAKSSTGHEGSALP